MTPQRIKSELNELNPDAYFFENMDSALLGLCSCGPKNYVALYSKVRIYDQLAVDGLSAIESDDYFNSHILPIWADVNTPVIFDDFEEL